MKREEIIAKLRERQSELHRFGVTRVALFGSRARGDERPDSDTDLLVEIDPHADLSIFEYVRLKSYLASVIDGPVDVVNRAALKPCLRPPAEQEAIYAF